MSPPSGLIGGFGATKETPDVETTALLSSVRGEVEKQLSTTFSTFEPHSVRTQVVAGTNYRCKVHVGDSKYVHMVVHQPLPHTKEPAKLMSAEGGKTLEDAL
ncbi:cystatin-b-like [Nannochloropsis oceanica]